MGLRQLWADGSNSTLGILFCFCSGGRKYFQFLVQLSSFETIFEQMLRADEFQIPQMPQAPSVGGYRRNTISLTLIINKQNIKSIMEMNSQLSFNNVYVLSISPGRGEKMSYSSILNGSSVTSSYQNYGISFVLENRNTSPVRVSLYFNKIENRDKNGVLLNERTPVTKSVDIPPNEKVFAFLDLGISHPHDKYDIRLNDIFLEYIYVNSQWSDLKNIQVYSPKELTKYSNITSERWKNALIWLLLGGIVIGCLIAMVLAMEVGSWITGLLAIALSAFVLYRAFVRNFKQNIFKLDGIPSR